MTAQNLGADYDCVGGCHGQGYLIEIKAADKLIRLLKAIRISLLAGGKDASRALDTALAEWEQSKLDRTRR